MTLIKLVKVASNQDEMAGLKRLQLILEWRGYAATLEQAFDVWVAAAEAKTGNYLAPSFINWAEFPTNDKLWDYVSPVICEI